MEEKLTPYELAVLAREVGFNQHQKYCYDPLSLDVNHIYSWGSEYDCSTKERMNRLVFAPTLSFLQKWLREEHKIDVWVKPFMVSNRKEYLGYVIFSPNKKEGEKYITHKSYEDALEYGLKFALNKLKK